jgi:hypothetical protein
MVLRQILLHPLAYVMPEPQMLIPFSRQKFDENGDLVDEVTRERLGRFLSALAKWTRRFEDPMKASQVERPGPVDVTTPFQHGRTVVPLLLNARVTPPGSTPCRSAVLLLAGSHPNFLCRRIKSRDLGNGVGSLHCTAGEPSVVPTSAPVKIGGMHGVTGAFARVSLSHTTSSSTMGT